MDRAAFFGWNVRRKDAQKNEDKHALVLPIHLGLMHLASSEFQRLSLGSVAVDYTMRYGSRADEPVPRPLRHLQAVRHIVRRAMVTSHRGGRRPGEVFLEDSPQALVAREPNIVERPIETGDGPLVHVFVQAVAAVNPDDRSFIAILFGVSAGPPSASVQYAARRSVCCGW
jgi:hypothetical protein